MRRRLTLATFLSAFVALPAWAASPPAIRFEPVGPSPTPKSATHLSNEPIILVKPLVPIKGLSKPSAQRRTAPVVRRAAPWPGTSGPVDERPLWNLLHAHRYAELRRMIAVARAARPRWQPPQQMLDVMRNDELGADLKAAASHHDHKRIVALEEKSPGLFTPDHLDARWTWIGALVALGRPDDALSAVLATLDEPLSDRDRIATLQKSLDWLGAAGQESLINLELARPYGPTMHAELTRLLVDAHVARLGAVLKNHDDKTAQALAGDLGPDVIRRRDAHLAVALGWLARRTGDPAVAKSWFDRAAAWAPDDTEVISAIAQAGETPTAERLIRRFRPDDPRRADLERLLVIMDARKALQEHRADEALELLERTAEGGPLPPDAQLLRIRAELELGRMDEAAKQARSLGASTPQRQEAMRAVALARAYAAFKEHRWPDVMHFLAEPGLDGVREARLLRAWTLFNLGESADAASMFDRLFEERGDAKAAEGLYFAATKAGRQDLIEKHRSHPAFATMLAEQRGREALAQGHYALAAAEAPNTYAQLSGYGNPDVKLGISRRDRTGEAGLSRLQVTREPIGAVKFGVTPRDEARVTVDRLIMDTGPVGASATVGSAPVGVAGPPPGFGSTQAIGIEPHLHYDHVGGGGLHMDLGITPTGGPLPSAWTGELGYDASDDLGVTSIGAFARPVSDSRLSLIGMVDPFTGKAWGRVTSLGVDLGRTLTLSAADNINGSLQIAALTGDSVADNDRTALTLGWRRAIEHPTFAYLAWGVDGMLQTYRRNLDGFTLGNGGYYSPQLEGRFRLAIDARTVDLKPFVLSASLGVGPGYAWVDQDPYFPLSPDGRTYDAYERTTIYYDADLRAVTHVTDWAQAGLGVTIYRNADYEEHVIQLFTRIMFGPRGVAVAGDLE